MSDIYTSQFETGESMVRQKQVIGFLRRLNNLPTSAVIPLPIDWQEENRYMPLETTDYPGQFSRKTAPQFTEILNRIHPDDPTTKITVMKSVQSAGTVTFGEGAMGFFTKYKLGSVFYLTSSKNVGKIRSSSAMDSLIDNAGLGELLSPISGRMKRKTADTTFYKEFAGGIKWLISSYNSMGDLKSNSFHLIICDEFDEAKAELGDQGDIAGIIEGRTMASRLYKILEISTPSRMGSSRIHNSFLEGDQRRYFMPCPECGEHQVLVLKESGQKHGLTFGRMKDPETGSKILDTNSVRYVCISCHREFYESQKQHMLENGIWKPTWMQSEHKPKDVNHKSYALSGLISPFMPWDRFCQEYINTDFGENLLRYKNFVINYKGEPWGNVEITADWKKIRDRAEDYCLGEVPAGGLRIFGGADVQGDRIELMILAVGKGMETWVVDYQIFYGDTSDLDGDAWTALDEFVYGKTYNVEGTDVLITLVAVDSNWDPNLKNKNNKSFAEKTNIVYSFVAHRIDKFIAIKGTKDLKSTDVIRPARIQGSLLKTRYDVATWILKEMAMNEVDTLGGPKAYHFPRFKMINGLKVGIDDEFYQQFLSEQFQETSPGVMGWKKLRSRNEVWDTFHYGKAAMYRVNQETWNDDMYDRYRESLLS